MHIVPAILEKDFREIRRKIELVKGAADTVQIDVADGTFAPNKTWPYGQTQIHADTEDAEARGFFISDYQRDYLRESASFVDFEFDLMVSKPQEIISDWVRIGATRIILHIESVEPDTLTDVLREWKHSVDIGLALKPSTPIGRLETFLHEVSFVQCMGNDRIAFQGVTLDESVLEKIRELQKLHPSLDIGVDIGVNLETAPRLIEAGATRLAAGSAVFGKADPAEAIKELEALFHE